MKKNVSIVNGLLLLPLIATSSSSSMETAITTGTTNEKAILTKNDKKQSLLEESVIITPVPTTRGLGFFRSTQDLVWNEEDNLHSDLEKKIFDVKNSSYHRKLDTAVEIYSSKKNSEKLASIFTLCRQEPYKGKVKINDSSATMAHIFLTQENKTKQKGLKDIIEKKDLEFIKQYNTLLGEAQDTLLKQIRAMSTLLDTHIKERGELVKENGDEIRVLKKALVNLHHLNKTFVLSEDKKTDGYCSDDEKDADNVANSYNDEHLLNKNNLTYSMAQTKSNTEKVLARLYVINTDLTDLEPITYKTSL